MGLPQINSDFKSKGVSAIKRSGRGIIALIIKDDTEGTFKETVYKSITDIDFTKISQRNYEYLKLIYKSSPAKVIVMNIGSTGQVSDALKKLKHLKFNYLVMPAASPEDTLTISTWIKEQRGKKKTFKAVLGNSKSDHEAIINFTTKNIKSVLSETVFNTVEYTARIAGVLASLDLSRSSTFYGLDDIVSIEVHEDPDAAIDRGELIIIFDGDAFKIGRGVNSFTSFTTEKGQDFSKIKIVEGIDLYNDDIRDAFEKSYVGKFRNDYDNKQSFVAAINGYIKSIEGDILDKNADNYCEIDVEAQRAYLEEKGISTEKMDELNIKTYNTGSHLFVCNHVKFVDAMEDMDLITYL